MTMAASQVLLGNNGISSRNRGGSDINQQYKTTAAISSIATGRGSFRSKIDYSKGYLEINVLGVRDLRIPSQGAIDHHIEFRYKGKLYQTSPNWFD